MGEKKSIVVLLNSSTKVNQLQAFSLPFSVLVIYCKNHECVIC